MHAYISTATMDNHHPDHHGVVVTELTLRGQCDAAGAANDDSLNASLSRKRKISKMWDTICGNTGPDAVYLGQQLFGHIGRPPDDPNRQPHKEIRKDSTTKMANWRVEDIDGGLAADFDDSLSGLGVELGSSTYNMSEALLALPPLPVFKQEATENGCRQGTTSGSQTPTASSCAVPSHVSPSHLLHTGAYPISNSMLGQNRFQYVLGAATSIATKMHEETLTYLNQGQSYEIKLKKLGDLTEFRGKLLKSTVRVCFHERRLQYMEKEQIASWRHTRPGERILEIDVPLSYGICEVVQDQIQLNACEFVWDPTKETGVFVRVNCISTEFTPKKHGGEKGVPFRIQIETFAHSDGPPPRLHCASCQVKVFKPKGADRKHKTDREKMEKKTTAEQEKFQPSYDCTVLTECQLDTIYTSPGPPPPPSVSSSITQKNDSFQYSPSPDQRPPGTPTSMTADSPVGDQTNDSMDSPVLALLQMYQQPLQSDASATQTAQWLQANRFGQYVRTFSSFSGADILRLSRDDMIQICGLADGIRLYNALHSKAIRPRLTLYICLEPEQVYHAIYLDSLTVDEVLGKLAVLMNIQAQQIHDIFVQGPSGIHVLVTDEVIHNIHDESMFAIEVIKDQTSDFFRLLLKTTSPR